MTKYQRTRNHLYSTTAIAAIATHGETKARLSFDNWYLVDSLKQRLARQGIELT